MYFSPLKLKAISSPKHIITMKIVENQSIFSIFLKNEHVCWVPNRFWKNKTDFSTN